jgi:hypothetical protein
MCTWGVLQLANRRTNWGCFYQNDLNEERHIAGKEAEAAGLRQL